MCVFLSERYIIPNLVNRTLYRQIITKKSKQIIMKNTFKKSSLLLLFVLAILFSSRAFGQFSSTAPGGSSTEYNNAPVGIQLGSPYTLTPSNVSLDLKNNFALRGGTLVFNSYYGCVDFGDGNVGGTDALFFRSLSTQGDYTTWTTRMLLSYTG